jgi:formate-dependent nitrite reductase cytochrome c552 subunit
MGRGRHRKFETKEESIKVNQEKYKKRWMEVIFLLGADKCSKCGYEKCFAAIDFHHADPKSKDISISQLIRLYKPTKEKIEKFKEDIETKRLISLCANCHREYHFEIGGRGRPRKNNLIVKSKPKGLFL